MTDKTQNNNNNNNNSTNIKDIGFKNGSIKMYKDIMSVPSVDGAVIVNKDATEQQDINLSIFMSQTDLVNKKEKSYIINKSVDSNGKVHTSPFPVELVSSIVSISPSGKKMLTIKEVGEGDYTFDLVDQSHQTSFIQSKEIHKKICNDEWFGRISWSPCEQYIAYIAEKKVDTASFFDKDPKEKIVGDQYLYRNDWGETYATICSPSIYVVDLVKESVISVPWASKPSLTAGQVIWTPNQADGLIFVGWNVDLRRYGIRACFNRQSSIYYIDFKSFIKKRESVAADQVKTVLVEPVNLLGDTIGCFRSPRFTLDGKKLLFLGMPGVVLPHNSCSQLFEIDWTCKPLVNKSDIRTLIGEGNHKDVFKGLYDQALPTNPWLAPSTLIFATASKSKQVIYLFNIESKELIPIKSLNGGSNDVLDVNLKSSQFIMSESSINQPKSLYLVNVKDKTKKIDNSNLEFKQVFVNQVNENVNKMLNDMEWYMEDIKVTGDRFGSDIDSFEIIQVLPKGNKKVPLLLFPHGGPHVSSSCDYQGPAVFLASLGYAVTLINYRGSTAFGKDFVDILPGRIGTVDVDDCLAALDHLLVKHADRLDSNYAGVIGGSHGGFLAAHLTGLVKQRMKVAIMRNPVIDLPSMSTLSDIPDWTFFEVGIPLPSPLSSYPTLPSIQDLELMRKLSPSAHLENMVVPTLLALGDSDMRVPPSQGVLLYNALLQKGTPVKCVMYPKTGHALASIDAKIDQWIHIACWLREYMFIE